VDGERDMRRFFQAALLAFALLIGVAAPSYRSLAAQSRAEPAAAPCKGKLAQRTHCLPPSAASHHRDGAAKNLVRAYAAAFATGRYAVMWSLLSPASRAGWTDETVYATFFRRKFASTTLRSYSIGTTARGQGGTHVSLTLNLVWRSAGDPGPLTLLRNLDVVVANVHGRPEIARGGPLDREAPVIVPPKPAPVVLHVPILMYHHISSLPPLAYSQVGLTVTDDAFSAQLAYLRSHGYHSITLVDLFDALYYGTPLPANPVVLTFDDGYLDNYTDAYPLLRRYGMVGEFAVISAYPGITLGVNRYMTWEQIQTMAVRGMEVESHTIDHQDLGAIAPMHAVYEIQFSRAMLEGSVHHAVQFLTYPSGEPFRSGTAEAQTRVSSVLKQFGYVGALLDQVTPSTREDARTPYQLPRVRVDRATTLDQFAANLSAP